MRIALIAHQVRPTGGQDRYVLELARQLSARHEVHVLATRAEGLEGTGVVVHRFGLAVRPALLLAGPFARRATLALDGAGFDVTHSIGGAMPGATVITAQYCHAAWHVARGRFRVVEASLAGRWYQRRVGAQAVDFERRAYADPRLKAVVAVSRRTGEELTNHYSVPGELITVIPNGVDQALFDRARYPGAREALRSALGIAPESPVALLVGTYARKGLETAIGAVARAAADLHLVVAGEGNRGQARRWARSAGIGGRLHLLGPRREIAPLFAAADLFVLPTRYEPFGMVIAEAMASSLPVVVSACAGAAELIEPGGNGWLIERPDDVEGFAAAMGEILASPARAAAAGERAREAVRVVDWPAIAARTEEVYRRAAA